MDPALENSTEPTYFRGWGRMETTLAIENELAGRLNFYRDENRFLEARRIEERTRYDLEMIKELGYCSGIENYSRHLSARRRCAGGVGELHQGGLLGEAVDLEAVA